MHVTPEADLGGPLALIKDGDRIRLSAAEKRIDLLVDETELKTRRTEFNNLPTNEFRGYRKLYRDSVLPAPEGCDFDFLRSVD